MAVGGVRRVSRAALSGPQRHRLGTLQRGLQTALTDAEAEGSTKPLSAWKKRYLTKDAHDQPILRDQVSGRKLRALGHVYYDYLVAMEAAELYDYDDMILRVVHRLEVSPELRFDLQ